MIVEFRLESLDLLVFVRFIDSELVGKMEWLPRCKMEQTDLTVSERTQLMHEKPG